MDVDQNGLIDYT